MRTINYETLWNNLLQRMKNCGERQLYADEIVTSMEIQVSNELRYIENAKTWDSLKEIKLCNHNWADNKRHVGKCFECPDCGKEFIDNGIELVEVKK